MIMCSDGLQKPSAGGDEKLIIKFMWPDGCISVAHQTLATFVSCQHVSRLGSIYIYIYQVGLKFHNDRP